MNLDELAEMMRTKTVRDECNDWRISGKRGDITEDGKGFSIWVRLKSKAMMKKCHEIVSEFCERRQNGDIEGIYHAKNMKSENAAVLVKMLKIRQKKVLSPETLAKLTERMRGISDKRRKGSAKTV